MKAGIVKSVAYRENVAEEFEQLRFQWFNGNLINVGVFTSSDVFRVESVDCLVSQVGC